MTPRERVLTALRHEQPDRTPFCWGFGPQPAIRQQLTDYLQSEHGVDFACLNRKTNDIRPVSPDYTGPTLQPHESIWGYTYKKVSFGHGSYDEFDYAPLAEADSVDAIEAHSWPDPDAYDYDGYAAKLDATDPDGRFVLELGGGNIFEQFTWLVGLENTMILMAMQPDVVHAGFRKITDFFVTRARKALQAADGRVHTFFGADDLGSQNGLLFSRQMYRDLLFPYHKELYSTIHEFGVKVCHHSDGSCFELLDDLIEAGVDCLEAVQVECAKMEPESLKSNYIGRLAFRGAVSVQQLLPRVGAEEVRTETRRLKQVLGDGGGYICQPSHAIQAGTPVENVLAMLEEALQLPMDEIVKLPE
jgi:uroporphyrinogen decarboxylase